MNSIQKRRLYEAVMKAVRNSLLESAEYPYEDIKTILNDEFPLSITTYAGVQEDTYEVSVDEYNEDDKFLYFHAETEVGFYVDFSISVDDFLEEYSSKPVKEIVEWYLVDAVEDEVSSQYSHGEYDHDINADDDEYLDVYDEDLDESTDTVEQYYYVITLQDGTEVYNSLDDDLSYDSYDEAEYECNVKLDDIVNEQADDDDAFMIGDYRTKIIKM